MVVETVAPQISYHREWKQVERLWRSIVSFVE